MYSFQQGHIILSHHGRLATEHTSMRLFGAFWNGRIVYHSPSVSAASSSVTSSCHSMAFFCSHSAHQHELCVIQSETVRWHSTLIVSVVPRRAVLSCHIMAPFCSHSSHQCKLPPLQSSPLQLVHQLMSRPFHNRCSVILIVTGAMSYLHIIKLLQGGLQP